jgi:hypothetical protein
MLLRKPHFTKYCSDVTELEEVLIEPIDQKIHQYEGFILALPPTIAYKLPLHFLLHRLSALDIPLLVTRLTVYTYT